MVFFFYFKKPNHNCKTKQKTVMPEFTYKGVAALFTGEMLVEGV